MGFECEIRFAVPTGGSVEALAQRFPDCNAQGTSWVAYDWRLETGGFTFSGPRTVARRIDCLQAPRRRSAAPLSASGHRRSVSNRGSRFGRGALGSGTDEQVTGVSDEQGRTTETTSPAEETSAQAAGPALGDEAETELHAAALPQLPMADAVGCRILRGCKRS